MQQGGTGSVGGVYFGGSGAVADEFGGRGTKEETDSRENPDFLGSGDLAVSEFSRGPDCSQ